MKKILGLSIAAVIIIAMVLTSTAAFFNNTERSTGDLITAGTLNLVDTITGSATNASVATTDGADSINDTVNFGATDPIRPGSSGVVTWTLNNTGNLPGTLTIVSTATFSEGAAPNEPELAADADSSQGLDDELLVWVTLNNGTTTSAVLGTEASPVALSGLAAALSLQSVQMGRVTVDTNATLIYVLHWNVPAETVGNEIQGDSATLNVAFTLTQNA